MIVSHLSLFGLHPFFFNLSSHALVSVSSH
jgi:hypothetical protein